jgi:hypothetical protein
MTVEAKNKPLNKILVDEFISFSGNSLDMILQYVPEDKGYYLIFSKYPNKNLRQVYTQRNTPRKFKDLQRAIVWGKRMGFRSVTITIDYDLYIDPSADDA